jgi:2-polyprenyl-3-methyl-5-hydroxy-6-metoxy-1,4-benzoquinol methylase
MNFYEAKKMQEDYNKFYKDYWKNSQKKREETKYFQKRYNNLKKLITPPKDSLNIVDIGGGDGHFLHYLNIKSATVVDISDGGLKIAKNFGYKTIKQNIHKRFNIKENTYDFAYCFEVLEHLNHPSKTLSEINNILKSNGILMIGQPNTPADGKHHVRRIYLKELVNDLKKTGFKIEHITHIPSFNTWEYKNKKLNLIGFIGFILSFIPFPIRKILANLFPNRFSLMYIIKAKKVKL